MAFLGDDSANYARAARGTSACWRLSRPMFPPYPERVISPTFIGYGKNLHRVMFVTSGRANTISMTTMLDIAIQTRDCPGQMEAILGELKQLRESSALLKKRQTHIEAELSLAASVQQSLAPRSLVWNDVSVETHYSPAHTIGGDFGIVFPHNNIQFGLSTTTVIKRTP